MKQSTVNVYVKYIMHFKQRQIEKIDLFWHWHTLLIYFSFSALEAQSMLGGEDLIPFYGLLEGGREGELFKELEDYFYYAQIRRWDFIIQG